MEINFSKLKKKKAEPIFFEFKNIAYDDDDEIRSPEKYRRLHSSLK